MDPFIAGFTKAKRLSALFKISIEHLLGQSLSPSEA